MRALRFTLLFALLACATPASAQLSFFREHERQMDSGKLAVGLDLGAFFGTVEHHGYSFVQPTTMLGLRLGEVVFDTALPLAYYHENNQPGADHDQLSLGNPWFALEYLPDCTCGLSRLTLGIAADVTTAHDARDRAAIDLARAVMGGFDAYLWVDRMLPLVVGAGTLKEASRLRLAWDGDVVFGLPAGFRDFELGMQTAGELALRFGLQGAVGARAALAYFPTVPSDAFQSSITAFLRFARASGDSFGLRFVLNLDSPAGFSFSRDGVWGAGLFYAATF